MALGTVEEVIREDHARECFTIVRPTAFFSTWAPFSHGRRGSMCYSPGLCASMSYGEVTWCGP